ncbi:hypothetical protein [Brevibacillus reuszeri]|uniref:hypothetical protein n=1 Tax=Brevibacillus reuszeri TaxID=54915 RepID=UPI000CCC3AA0|nr:hypothetical protein [Brevibacillus reuszeri]
MKNLLILSSFVLVFFAITGCGSSNSATPSTQEASTNQSTSSSSEEEAKKKAEEEAKQKEIDAAKKQEEAAKEKAVEEAKAKEAAEFEKYKIATYMTLFVPKLDELNGNGQGAEFPSTATEFIKSKIHLFPATGEKITETKKLVDKNVQFKHLNKNITKYTGAMFSDKGYVVSIEEVEQTEIGTVSVLHVLNDEQNSYQIVYPGELDIFEEDLVEFVGVPTLVSGFENVSGGHTNVVMLVGSYVGKSK